MSAKHKKKQDVNGIDAIVTGVIFIVLLGGFFSYVAATVGSFKIAFFFILLAAGFIFMGSMYILSAKFSRAKKILDGLIEAIAYLPLY